MWNLTRSERNNGISLYNYKLIFDELIQFTCVFAFLTLLDSSEHYGADFVQGLERFLFHLVYVSETSLRVFFHRREEEKVARMDDKRPLSRCFSSKTVGPSGLARAGELF